jgi:hypothetical protein
VKPCEHVAAHGTRRRWGTIRACKQAHTSLRAYLSPKVAGRDHHIKIPLQRIDQHIVHGRVDRRKIGPRVVNPSRWKVVTEIGPRRRIMLLCRKDARHVHWQCKSVSLLDSSHECVWLAGAIKAHLARVRTCDAKNIQFECIEKEVNLRGAQTRSL